MVYLALDVGKESCPTAIVSVMPRLASHQLDTPKGPLASHTHERVSGMPGLQGVKSWLRVMSLHHRPGMAAHSPGWGRGPRPRGWGLAAGPFPSSVCGPCSLRFSPYQKLQPLPDFAFVMRVHGGARRAAKVF